MTNILIIGGGNMGLTYALSIQQKIKNASVNILENNEEKIASLKANTTLTIYDNAADCIPHANAILLAVKPQTASLLFNHIKQWLTNDQLIISIMAGTKIKTIQDGLQLDKVVRAMPNLPSQVNQGMTGFIASEEINALEINLVKKILGATGAIVQVNKEDEIDVITALSGSGPAYVFYFMEAMIQQGMQYGFSYEDAKTIVVNTFIGTANLFKASNTSAQVWIDRVTSKGGTTHAAMETFKKNDVALKIKDSVTAAYDRAQELGKQ